MTRSLAAGAVAAAMLCGDQPAPSASPKWFRGNTHVHTRLSDGNASPEEVVRWYREHGYHFVVLTDHNRRIDVGPLQAAFNVPGEFLVVAGVEVTDRAGRQPVHVNGLFVSRTVMPQGGSSAREALDRDVAAIAAANGIAQLNHPNGLISQPIQPEAVIGASGRLRLFEVCCADFRGGGGVLSTDELWDRVLTAGRTLFGVAADDAHRFGGEAAEAGTAWIVVRAAELSERALRDALWNGSFYATTGVRIDDYEVTSDRVVIRLSDRDSYRYRNEFIGAGGRVLARDQSFDPEYRWTGDEQYVRARIERSDGRLGWTQPIRVAPSPPH
jgi:hypothetical protein